MLNMLVIIQNKTVGIKVINTLSEYISDIRLLNFCNNSNEAFNILNNKKADFILLEINSNNNFGIDILNYLNTHSTDLYYNSIILIGNNPLYNTNLIFDSLDLPIKRKKLCDSISNLCKYKDTSYTDTSIRSKIISLLKNLNFDLSHIGTKYLIEVIFEIYYKKNYLGNDLKNNIYINLSHKYNKSINTIYGSIKYSVQKMYDNSDHNFLTKYFLLDKPRKPKVTEIIYKIINQI